MHFNISLLLPLALGLTTVSGLCLPTEHSALALQARDGPKPAPLTCPTLPDKQHGKGIRRGKYFKISAFVQKLDNVTAEYFDQYWTQCDIPLALDCKDFTKNVAKFNQIHQTPELKASFVVLDYPMLDYDGIIEFWVRDIPTWQKVTSSECWQGVRDDAKTFAKWPFQFMYGYEILTFAWT